MIVFRARLSRGFSKRLCSLGQRTFYFFLVSRKGMASLSCTKSVESHHGRTNYGIAAHGSDDTLAVLVQTTAHNIFRAAALVAALDVRYGKGLFRCCSLL